MASRNDCLRAIDAAARGELSEAELDELVDALDRIRKAHRAQDNLDGLEDALFDAAGRIEENVTLAAKIEKRNRLQNIVVENRLFRLGEVAHEQLGDASLGIESAQVGINSPLDGGRRSADSLANGMMRSWLGGMLADLRAQNLHGLYARGGEDLERDISKELWDISQTNPTGRATDNQDAKKIAQIVQKYRRAAVQRENRAGAFIRFLDGYITRQTHDRAKMERAGKDVWKQNVRNRLDWDRMEVAPEDREGFLDSVYDALVTGVRKDVRGGEENDLLFAFKGPGNLAKKASQDRVLHFKSADDWFDYNKQFGQNELREAINNDLRRAAQNAAIMDVFGTNPKAMFDKVRDRLKEKYRSDPEQIRRLERKSLDWFQAEIDGSVNVPLNYSLANVARSWRALQSMAKLGGSWISSWADLAATASERRYQGRSMMDSWQDALTSVVEGMSPGDSRHTSELIAVGLDGSLGDFTARHSAQDDAPGKVSKAMRLFFRLNLLGPWTDAIKRGVGLMMSRDLAMWAENGFDALPAKVQRNLRAYGLDARKWEIARKLTQEAPDGRRYMLPGEIDNIDIPEFRGRKGQRLKDEVRDSLFAYITERVETASPTPGARERALLRGGLQAGTPWGEAVRFIMQFKTFPITVISKVIGRDVYSEGSRGLKNAILKGEGDIAGLANFVAGSTVLGYFAMQAKEMAKGREPRDNTPGAFFAAALQGGGLGIYGDFLLSETDRYGRSFAADLTGPTVGTISDAKRVFDTIRAGDDAAASTLYLVKSNLPGANLFYAKTAFDYLVFYQMQEMTNPGYLRRMERRMEREHGQRFFIPPSKAIPRGGGGRILEGIR